MSFLGLHAFESVGKDLKAWQDLDSSEKSLYNQALALVQGEPCPASTARLVEIFTTNPHLNVNKTLVPIYGETLLQQAVHDEKVEYVKALLQLGADPVTENAMDGSTPLESLLMLDQEEYQGRNDTQNEILKLLEQAMGADYTQTLSKSDEEQTKELGQQVYHLFNEGYWAIGVNPAEVEEMNTRLKNEPDWWAGRLYLNELGIQMKQAEESFDPETLRFIAQRNKLQHQAKEIHKELGKEKSALIQEAFQLLKMTEEEQLYVSSGDALVKRFQEIYSTPGVSVTVPSMMGETLLFETVQNYILGDQYPDSQLELIKFLLESGADPNVEDSIGSTAQDHLDYEVEYKDLTVQEKKMIRLLKQAGGKIQAVNDNGEKVGSRGEGKSQHELAALQSND